jgi:hypothetical protein
MRLIFQKSNKIAFHIDLFDFQWHPMKME